MICFLLLEYAFIISDFSVQNVFFNSSTIIPLIYKISAAWSSHEGSMLLWLSMLSLIGILFILNLSRILDKENTKTKASLDASNSLISNIITSAAFVQVLFCSFIVYSSNPFTLFTSTVSQGLGLNPMLQDTALAIHPPMLYLGYTSLYGCFLTIICILLNCSIPQTKSSTDRQKEAPTGKLQYALFKLCRLFASIALTALTAAIGLGGWWAYRELGWGGYWFFDPVENISLLPWICAIIMHHSLIVVLKTQQLQKAASFFGLSSFIITLYGFFFVRSGIISSVHSFAFSPERGVYIISICLVITSLSLLLYFIKSRYLALSQNSPSKGETQGEGQGETQRDAQDLGKLSDKSYQETISKINTWDLISLGNILWSISLLVLLIAIIYPIYYSMVWDIDIAIDPSYFYSVFLPIFIPVFFLAGAGYRPTPHL